MKKERCLKEATLRSLKRTNPAKFEREHLGALCQANNINAEILETFIKDLGGIIITQEINDLQK